MKVYSWFADDQPYIPGPGEPGYINVAEQASALTMITGLSILALGAWALAKVASPSKKLKA